MVRHQAIKRQKQYDRLKQEVLHKTIKKQKKKSTLKAVKSLPAIVCDIDGVVVRGKD